MGGFLYLIINTAPDLTNILIATSLLALALFSLGAVFVNSRISLLVTTAICFPLFLKAVDLVTPTNVTLFIAFLILLAFYFKQNPPPKKEVSSTIHLPTHTLFPKGWPFQVGKKRKKEYNNDNE